MSDRSGHRIAELIDGVQGLADTERSEYLNRECGTDTGLRRAVERILALSTGSDGYSSGSGIDRFWEGLESGDTLVGQRIGPYRLTRILAHGGMGSVFLAHREDDFSQEVAIKLVLSGIFDKQAQQRLQFERQALARLEHPNIARLYDGGTAEDGLPYLVMERVKGLPIDQYCNDHQLSVRRRLQLLTPVLDAVAYAHSHLLVHCDIKPSNILVTEEGVPKLLDFGIAKLLGQTEPGQTALTVTGLRPMTLSHASPEQVTGGPISVASDIYALGILINTLLCGRLPYSVPLGHQLVLARAIVEQEPERPSRQVANGHPNPADPLAPNHAENCGTQPKELVRLLQGDLDAIVMKAIRKEPQQRYRSAQDLAADLRSYLDARPVTARNGTWQYRGSRLLRRMFWPHDPQRRRERWTWYAVFALLLAASATAFFFLRPPDPCLGAEERLAGVWDAETKSTVESAFSSSGLPFADDTWSRVEAALDQRTDDWVTTRTEVCRDTRTRGDFSPRLLDLAQLCLDGRLEELRALVRYFRDANEKTVIGAIESVAMLRDLDECRDPVGLAPRTTPPTDPETRQALASARAVVETQDLRLRVRQPVDFEALQKVEADLRDLGDSALRARALYVLGAAESDAKSSPEESIAKLEEALFAAIAGGDVPQQLRIYSTLIKTLARNQGDLERARFWYQFAEASLANLGPGHYALRHEIADAAGMMEWQAGDGVKSEQHHRQALKYAELSSDPVRRIRTLGNLGLFGGAKEYLEQSIRLIEKRFGADHVMLAQPLHNLAGKHAYGGRYETALALTRRSRSLLLATHGAGYPQLAFPQTLVGQLLIVTDRPEKAIEALEEAERIYRESGRDPNGFFVGSIRVSLAEAALMAGRLEEAEVHLRLGREILLAAVPETHETRQDLTRVAGDVAREAGRLDEALSLHRPVLERPDVDDFSGYVKMSTFYSVGRTLQAVDQDDAAVDVLESALDASTNTDSVAQPAGIRFHLAQLLWDADRARAERLLEEARNALATDLPFHRRLLAEIDAWAASLEEA